jgi:hypothetical protein
VVERQVDRERRHVQHLVVTAECPLEALRGRSRSTAARKPIVPKLMPNTGTPVWAKVAKRVEDAAVAAEHQADVGALAVRDPLDVRRPSTCFSCSSGVEIS